MVSISDEETVEVEVAPAADKPKAKSKAKRAPAKTKKVTVEIPADTVVDEDEDESGEGEAPPAAQAESPPAAEPPAGPAKVDMSNQEAAPKPVFVECEYCGKKVKKGGLGKHIANLAGDGIHPFKEELAAETREEFEDPPEESDFEVQPWMIALAAGIVGLLILVVLIVLGKKEGSADTTVNVTSAPPAQPAPAPAPVEHKSEPAMVEDANGNQIPITVVRNADGTYSASP